jgi:DNA polymerase elongation subunit (family B)
VAFRFGRREVGASVTGCGRQITHFMNETIGELVSGQECVIEKRYAPSRLVTTVTDEGETRSSYKTVISSDDLALYRKHCKWNELEKFPTRAGELLMYKGTAHPCYGAFYYSKNTQCIYSDTDSAYFSIPVDNYEDAVTIADDVASTVNDMFSAFMKKSFNCTEGREDLIKVAREVVAETGLFLTAKKKYTLKVVNLEGLDLREKPKLKSMGSEIKKADTPKVIQDFLKKLMDLILDKKPYSDIEKLVNESRGKLIHKSEDVLALGGAKQINNLDKLYADWTLNEKKNNKKINLPGHVRAAINYNELITQFQPDAPMIKSGDKGVVFYLMPNEFGLKSIAFPSDLMHIPQWFNENFRIDMALTEEKLIDSKIEGIFDAMGIEKPTLQGSYINSVFKF